MKVLVALIVVAVVLYLAALNYAATDARYQCAGMLVSKAGTQPALAELTLHRYRWWAALWSGSDGYLRIEMPEQSVDAFVHLDQAGDVFVFLDDANGVQGTFALSRRSLNVQTPQGLFGGTCVPEGTAP